jgi:hypothetical protein
MQGRNRGVDKQPTKPFTRTVWILSRSPTLHAATSAIYGLFFHVK